MMAHISKSTNFMSVLIWPLLYLLGTAILYYLIFTHNDVIASVILSKKIQAPLLSMFIVITASALYGSAVAILLKITLEKKLTNRKSK